jgi:hypothetical protein
MQNRRVQCSKVGTLPDVHFGAHMRVEAMDYDLFCFARNDNAASSRSRSRSLNN